MVEPVTELNGASPADEAAIAAASSYQLEKQTGITEMTLTNGIVLSLKPVPALVIGDAARRVEKPAVPTVWIEAKDREEENPNDPAYQDAVIQYMNERSEASLRVALVMGVEIKSVPDGYHLPAADEWIDDLEAGLAVSGVSLPLQREPPKARLLDYLRYYALVDEQDIVAVSTVLTSSAVVEEEDVRHAVEAFRNREKRARNLIGSLAGSDPDGDRVSDGDPGDGAGVGATGSGEAQPDSVD